MGGSIQLQALSFGREGRWWIGMMPRALLAVAVLIADFCLLFIFMFPLFRYFSFPCSQSSASHFNGMDLTHEVKWSHSYPLRATPFLHDTTLHRTKALEGPFDLTHQFTIQVVKVNDILETSKLLPHDFFLSRLSEHHSRSRLR